MMKVEKQDERIGGTAAPETERSPYMPGKVWLRQQIASHC